jgi:putative transcriptional regulator
MEAKNNDSIDDSIEDSIKVNLDLLLVQRQMSLTQLSEKVGVTIANLSILKRGKAKAIRFSTLIAICKALDCQPGDILELQQYIED